MDNEHRPPKVAQTPADVDEQMVANYTRAIKRMCASAPALIEYASFQAKLVRARFDALKAQGFSDEQAIELCKDTMK